MDIRYLGLKLKKNGKPFVQVAKDYETLERTKGGSLAEWQADVSEVQSAADDLLIAYEENFHPVKHVDYLGRIGYHSDGGRTHTAICVGQARNQCCLLFLTTHPTWNPFARPITKDEAMLVGLPLKQSQTFLAPVLRPEDEIYWSDNSFTSHRVEQLQEEFFSNIERISVL